MCFSVSALLKKQEESDILCAQGFRFFLPWYRMGCKKISIHFEYRSVLFCDAVLIFNNILHAKIHSFTLCLFSIPLFFFLLRSYVYGGVLFIWHFPLNYISFKLRYIALCSVSQYINILKQKRYWVLFVILTLNGSLQIWYRDNRNLRD